MRDEFREYAARRAPALRRTAYLLCGDWHQADDLVQDTLVKAYRHWRQIERADDPDAYVGRILVNAANDHWRRRRRTAQPVETALEDAVARDGTEAAVDRLALQQALARLPPRQRATVVLRFYEGLSERETARALGCSAGTVKSQTSRALRALSTHLQHEEIRS